MTSYDFIKSIATGERTKPGKVASLVFDGKIIYSYGAHYPLLFRIADKWILNDRGYSATTGKHISHARKFADYLSPVCKTQPAEIHPELSKIIEALKADIAKTRPGTKKQNALKARIEKLQKTLLFLQFVK